MAVKMYAYGVLLLLCFLSHMKQVASDKMPTCQAVSSFDAFCLYLVAVTKAHAYLLCDIALLTIL